MEIFRCEGAAKDREAAAEHSRIESTHRTPEAARPDRELVHPESAANRPAAPAKYAEAQANDVEARPADVQGQPNRSDSAAAHRDTETNRVQGGASGPEGAANRVDPAAKRSHRETIHSNTETTHTEWRNGRMEKRQRSAQRRFRRVREFLTTNPVEGTAVKLEVLDQVVNEMTSKGEEQDASDRLARGVTARQAALRGVLRNRHMAPISRIARRVFEVPEIRAKFLLPRKRDDNVAVLNSARGMAQVAEQHAAVFTQEGLPAEFLTQFRAAIDELAATLITRDQSQNRRKSSREALSRLVKRGVAAIDVLDAIVKPRLESQPDLLATWDSVKRHIEAGGGASAGSVEPDITSVKVA